MIFLFFFHLFKVMNDRIAHIFLSLSLVYIFVKF